MMNKSGKLFRESTQYLRH